MARLFHHRLQLLAGVKGDNTAGADRDLLAGLRIAAGTLRLVPKLEIAEAGELHAFAALERAADLFEEGFHHVLGLTFVEADLLKQQVGQLGLRQSHSSSPFPSEFS